MDEQIRIEIVNGVIHYNGDPNLYKVIWDLDEEFHEIPFSEQMEVLISLWNALPPSAIQFIF